MTITLALLGTAFYFAYRPSSGGAAASKIMAFNKAMLWAVTLVVSVFLFFPQAADGLFTSNEENNVVTEDMQKTVVKIEGMT